MANRPKIPEKIKRRIYRESGHQCSVCGTGTSLDIAHIVPWSETQDHSYENLICLCPTCHRQADNDSKWTQEDLRWYKQNPWVNRPRDGVGSIPSSPARILIRFEIDIGCLDEKSQRKLQHCLGELLSIAFPSASLDPTQKADTDSRLRSSDIIDPPNKKL